MCDPLLCPLHFTAELGAGTVRTSSEVWGPAQLLLRPQPAARLFPATARHCPQGSPAPSGLTPVSPNGDFREKWAAVPGPLQSPGVPGGGAPRGGAPFVRTRSPPGPPFAEGCEGTAQGTAAAAVAVSV